MSSLPEGFESLEPWVASWSLATQNERWDKRLGSTSEEIRAFYDAVLPKLPEILVHVDQFSLGTLPEPSQRLFHLALMHAEIAPNVELYGGDPNVPFSFEERRFIAAHGSQRGGG